MKLKIRQYMFGLMIGLMLIGGTQVQALTNEVILTINGRAWTTIDYNLFLNEKTKDDIQPVNQKMKSIDLFIMSRLLIEEASELGLLSKVGGLSDINNQATEKERLIVAAEIYSLKKKQIKTIKDEQKWIELTQQKYLFKFVSDDFRKL